MDDERPESVKKAEAESRQAKEDLEKLKTLLRRFQTQDGLTLHGHTHSYGADWYVCPCCGARKDIKGHAGPRSWDLAEVEHQDDCALIALSKEIASWG